MPVVIMYTFLQRDASDGRNCPKILKQRNTNKENRSHRTCKLPLAKAFWPVNFNTFCFFNCKWLLCLKMWEKWLSKSKSLTFSNSKFIIASFVYTNCKSSLFAALTTMMPKVRPYLIFCITLYFQSSMFLFYNNKIK